MKYVQKTVSRKVARLFVKQPEIFAYHVQQLQHQAAKLDILLRRQPTATGAQLKAAKVPQLRIVGIARNTSSQTSFTATVVRTK